MRILWRRVGAPGLEWCELEEGARRNVLHGVVLLAHGKQAWHLEYRIECDGAWETRKAAIHGQAGRKTVGMDLAVDSRKRWFLNGRHVARVDGCIDVDLGFSPSTNILPIRRLGLRQGKTHELTAAWVEFPSLELKPLPQAYRRISARTVHYESRGGKFTRDLETNPRGLVLRYPGIWEAELAE